MLFGKSVEIKDKGLGMTKRERKEDTRASTQQGETKREQRPLVSGTQPRLHVALACGHV